jgi:hypothetical protein
LAVCLTPRPFQEEQEVALEFQVVDDVSGLPLESALVSITDPFSREPAPVPVRAQTDHEGRARLTDRFIVDGERNAFQTLGTFSPWGRWLEISATSHCTRRVPLTEVVGPFVDPTRPEHGRVALTRGDTQAAAFRDLAGIYTDGRQGFGGSWFAIEPDGRFAWCSWGCVYQSEEYGYLKWHGKTIEMVLVPHPGRDTDPEFTARYWTIEWGARLYLCMANQHGLREFCRAALTPSRSTSSWYFRGSYFRESDRDKPRTGLPRLPMELWVRFLIDEMSLHDEESTLRRALDSLLPKVARSGRAGTAGRLQ